MFLIEKLSHPEENVGRNVDSKVHADGVSDRKEIRDLLSETRGKVKVVAKWQRTWLSCDCGPVFCER